MAQLLIVEDESSIADSLVFVFQNEKFSVVWKNLAQDALNFIRSNPVDLIVLDIGLPDMSGFELCKLIRQTSDVPILFLTSRSDELDRVVGFEIGADDYVVKPFSPREVVGRVRAILKRSHLLNRSQEIKNSSIEFRLDLIAKKIFYSDQHLTLTPLEFKLLSCLVAKPNRVFSRDELLDAMDLSTSAGYDRSVDTHIKGLRAKLREIKPESDPIKTQRGFGYFYQPEEA